MGTAFVSELIATIGRAHHGFWLRDRIPENHAVPAPFVLLLMFLLVALLTLTGGGTSIIASAIYAVYLLVSIILSTFVTYARTFRIKSRQVLVLVEAYLVALFITMLILSHNVFFPIQYFSPDAGVDRGKDMQALIAFGYSVPAGIFLAIRSQQIISRRFQGAFLRLAQKRHVEQLDALRTRLRLEIFIWSFAHYVVIAMIVWNLLFLHSTKMSVLNNALSTFKWP